MEKLPNDRNMQVGAYSNPDLSSYGIGTGPIKCLDPQVLFNPFEEQFYLPAKLIELSYCQGRRNKIVC